MENKRWSVYQVKSRAKGSTEKAVSPSTAGKAGRKAEKAGQSMGGRTKGSQKPSSELKGFDTRLELLNQLVAGWVRELKFHPVRRWRFDYAHESLKIAVEVEGGVWTGNSRHTRGKGYLADCEKYNQAQIMGYRVMRYAPKQLAEMVDDIEKMVEGICL